VQDKSTLSEGVSFSGYVNINCVKSIKQSDDETSSTEMEVEDHDEILQRLYFKKFGRALPEKKSDDVDLGMDLKDLTEKQDKMDAIPTLAPVNIVKKESIEIPKAVIHAVNQAKTVEFLTPKWMSQDKVACFSLKQAPSRRKSDFNRTSTKQTSLLRVDIKSPSDDASQDGTSVQTSWRLNSEQFIDSIIAAAKRKSEMNFPNYSRRREWRTLHQRTKEIINALIRISEHLGKIELNKTTVEVTGYLNCASHLTKIIPGMLESLTDHFVPEKENFCRSPPNPTSETSRAKSCNTKRKCKKKKKVQQQAKDIFTGSTTQHIEAPEVAPNLPGLTPRTDQEFYKSLNSQSSKSETLHAMQQVQEEDDKRRKDAADHTAKQYKLTSAGASSMPVGLTPRPDPNRTQQGHYAEASPQFMGQHFRQPPPMFPNPPPMPPNLPPFQQPQAAARYPKKLP
jgi:hypothetical protein